jgi:hypothetical protein
MPTRMQKEFGLDTVKIKNVDEKYAQMFNSLLSGAAESEHKTEGEIFAELTEAFAVMCVGPKYASDVLWRHTGIRKDLG